MDLKIILERSAKGTSPDGFPGAPGRLVRNVDDAPVQIGGTVEEGWRVSEEVSRWVRWRRG